MREHINRSCNNEACSARSRIEQILDIPETTKFIQIDELYFDSLDKLYELERFNSIDDILIEAIDLLLQQEGLEDCKPSL